MRELPQRHRPLLEGRRIVVALSVSGLVQQAGFASSEHTTALVTIAEANARCLIQTKQMKAAQAQNIANRSLTSKGVKDTDRNEVKSAPGYDDLMRRYIDGQGGYEELVRQLR